MKRFIVVNIVLCLLLSCKQDYYYSFDADKKYTVEKLTDDLDYLRYILGSSHPSLFDTYQRIKYNELIDSIYASIIHPMTLRDFFMILAPLTASLNCGHTYLSFPEGYWEKMDEKYTYLPLKLFFNIDKVYLLHNFSGRKEMPEGAEILEINGTPAHQIINNLLGILPSDGDNNAYKYHCMNELEFGLFPGNNSFPEYYTISYRIYPEDTAKESITIKALSRNDIIGNRKAMGLEEGVNESYSIKIIKGMNIPVITIREFAGYADKGYELFLKKAFTEINKSKAQSLIIDVRGNDGGDPQFAAELISYIIPAEVRYFTNNVYGYHNLKKPLLPKQDRFKGKVYILMDGGCFSTTGHFLSVIKYNKLATLIGEESGGTWTCNGCYKEFILPNTRIKLLCPRCVYNTFVEGMSRYRGIFPDIYTEQSVNDILNNRDRTMEECLNVIIETGKNIN